MLARGGTEVALQEVLTTHPLAAERSVGPAPTTRPILSGGGTTCRDKILTAQDVVMGHRDVATARILMMAWTTEVAVDNGEPATP
jgi:hypothetical protein